MKRLVKHASVKLVSCDQCMVGLKDVVSGVSRKTTTLSMTNSSFGDKLSLLKGTCAQAVARFREVQTLKFQSHGVGTTLSGRVTKMPGGHRFGR